MKLGEEVNFIFTHEDLLAAVEHARKEHFIDNLRVRNQFVSFDSKVRGYLGEISIYNYFVSNGIKINSVDRLVDGDSTDLDFSIDNACGQTLRVECKTSLIPDVWATLSEVIKKGDIKIIKREYDFHDIPIDVHLQIYFNQFRKRRDNFLCSLPGSIEDYSDEELISLMKLDTLREVFIAWMDKPTLEHFLEHQHYKWWKFGFRQFWRCPLEISKAPAELIKYLTE